MQSLHMDLLAQKYKLYDTIFYCEDTRPCYKAIIDSDHGFSPVRRQAINWINVGLLLTGPLGGGGQISVEL